MLTAEHLTCGHGGEPVVKDISLRVREGEKLSIPGPNGCGKATLLRALAGIFGPVLRRHGAAVGSGFCTGLGADRGL